MAKLAQRLRKTSNTAKKRQEKRTSRRRESDEAKRLALAKSRLPGVMRKIYRELDARALAGEDDYTYSVLPDDPIKLVFDVIERRLRRRGLKVDIEYSRGDVDMCPPYWNLKASF